MRSIIFVPFLNANERSIHRRFNNGSSTRLPSSLPNIYLRRIKKCSIAFAHLPSRICTYRLSYPRQTQYQQPHSDQPCCTYYRPSQQNDTQLHPTTFRPAARFQDPPIGSCTTISSSYIFISGGSTPHVAGLRRLH